MPDRQEEHDLVEKELADLEARLIAEAEAEDAEPAPEAPAAPAEQPAEAPAEEPAKPSEPDLKKAAEFVFLNDYTPEERTALMRKAGLTVAEEKKIEEGERNVATASAKIAASEAVKGLRAKVGEDELAKFDGFDDLDPEDQGLIMGDIIAKRAAREAVEAEMAPRREAEAKQAMAQELQATAVAWAAELGNPKAAEAVHGFIGQFPPEYVEAYKKEVAAGGGPLSYMVAEQVKRIVSEASKADEAKTAKPVPKSEDVGGITNDGPVLTGDALEIYNDMKASGKLTDAELAATRKELAKVR